MCYVSTDERRQGEAQSPLDHVLRLPQEQVAEGDPSAEEGTDEAQGLPTARRGLAVVLERPPVPLWRPRARRHGAAGGEHAVGGEHGLRRRTGVRRAEEHRDRLADGREGPADVSRNSGDPSMLADGRGDAELPGGGGWRHQPWLAVQRNGSHATSMGHTEDLGPLCRLHQARRRLGSRRFALLATLLLSSALLVLLAAYTTIKCRVSLAELRARRLEVLTVLMEEQTSRSRKFVEMGLSPGDASRLLAGSSGWSSHQPLRS